MSEDQVNGIKESDEGKKTNEANFRRLTVLALQGTEEYNQFVEGVCLRARIKKPYIFDIAFAEWAQRNGYGNPPSRLG